MREQHLILGCGCAGIKGNVVLYTTLMNVCRRGGQPERAMAIFRTMETDGVQLDVVSPSQPIFTELSCLPRSHKKCLVSPMAESSLGSTLMYEQ